MYHYGDPPSRRNVAGSRGSDPNVTMRSGQRWRRLLRRTNNDPHKGLLLPAFPPPPRRTVVGMLLLLLLGLGTFPAVAWMPVDGVRKASSSASGVGRRWRPSSSSSSVVGPQQKPTRGLARAAIVWHMMGGTDDGDGGVSGGSYGSRDNGNGGCPQPPVWVYQHRPRDRHKSAEDDDDENGADENESRWRSVSAVVAGAKGAASPMPVADSAAVAASRRTWDWCRKFVVPLGLCPWAGASVETPGAVQFFVVPAAAGGGGAGDRRRRQQQRELDTAIVQDVARRFDRTVCRRPGPEGEDDADDVPPTALERAAIYFVLFIPDVAPNDGDGADPPSLRIVPGGHRGPYEEALSPSSSSVITDDGSDEEADDFFDFYDWFEALEDEWDLDDVIVAPFHPEWEFASFDGDEGKGDLPLQYEKRSPHPLVSLVSARVVDQAGEAATVKIGQHNRDVLLDLESDRGRGAVGRFWRSAVFGSNGVEEWPAEEEEQK